MAQFQEYYRLVGGAQDQSMCERRTLRMVPAPDPVPQAAQLALDPDHAPAGIVFGQLDDQAGQLTGQRRASRCPRLGPLLGHHALVSAAALPG
jgi:hypothetical protein